MARKTSIMCSAGILVACVLAACVAPAEHTQLAQTVLSAISPVGLGLEGGGGGEKSAGLISVAGRRTPAAAAAAMRRPAPMVRAQLFTCVSENIHVLCTCIYIYMIV